ncbi:MAG: hypothetical protein EPN47_01340 [Acidobacteria bacterium]|nr:MAG: hypothetical protein EPN47_01340 [Acidobacteriota bacterium]
MSLKTIRRLGKPRAAVLLLMLAACLPVRAQDAGQGAASLPDPRWNFHFQSTLVGQGVLPFPAKYSGANSLEANGELKNTLSFDVGGDVRLWRGGEFVADVLVWQGYGLSNATGVAGFPNGEAYRVGKTYPDAYLSRAYLRETITLGAEADASAGPNPASSGSGGERLTFMVGHYPVTDVFDKNRYANDPRTQFMNWSLVNNVAWDYAANSLGITNGASAAFDVHSWSARLGIFQVSQFANGIRMDWNIDQAHFLTLEVEHRFALNGHAGAARLLAYRESAHMGNYQDSLADPQSISSTGQLAYRSKYGLGLNLEQEIHKDIGAFARLGWSDGRNQIWEFTDVDRTASAGISLEGNAWDRPGDTAGLAAVVNGISAVHRQFIANGGLGITVGDGRLSYRKEEMLEAYYSFATRWGVSISPDFQFVVDPAYNRDRGPAPIFALRFHWER